MKAMILAAGFGSRLLPYTNNTPKPLFPLAKQPLLDILIKQLQKAGCKAVMVNTHHLHEKIQDFISRQQYKIPVTTCYEPKILGTGGAIANVADFWDKTPFMVINSDIFTDIDFLKVYKFHVNHNYPVTLVMYDDNNFNCVSVNNDSFVTGFHENCCLLKKRTFTGIQVLDPEVLDFIQAGVFSSSIEAYKKILDSGKKIKAFIADKYIWKDMGTPERYKSTAISELAKQAFKKTRPDCLSSEIKITQLKGDGSDRKWYRLSSDTNSLIMVDHGISDNSIKTLESDSFINIGQHLFNKGNPVPEILIYDRFSGLAVMEDLGDIHLQTIVNQSKYHDKIIFLYKNVIDLLINLFLSGAEDFKPYWTWQTERYDHKVIIEYECRYFIDAFLRNYIGSSLSFENFQDEFEFLANKIVEYGINGFMHRDMQSRNIMYKNDKIYFIDFQGGRLGPIQYDLASLLIDPYTALSYKIQNQLLTYCFKKLSWAVNVNNEQFVIGYKFCSLARNLQILGAFGYLNCIKKKIYFADYIPQAIKNLKHILSGFPKTYFPKLTNTMLNIKI